MPAAHERFLLGRSWRAAFEGSRAVWEDPAVLYRSERKWVLIALVVSEGLFFHGLDVVLMCLISFWCLLVSLCPSSSNLPSHHHEITMKPPSNLPRKPAFLFAPAVEVRTNLRVFSLHPGARCALNRFWPIARVFWRNCSWEKGLVIPETIKLRDQSPAMIGVTIMIGPCFTGIWPFFIFPRAASRGSEKQTGNLSRSNSFYPPRLKTLKTEEHKHCYKKTDWRQQEHWQST